MYTYFNLPFASPAPCPYQMTFFVVEEELVVPCQRDIIYHYQSFAQPQNGSEHQQTKKAQFKKKMIAAPPLMKSP